MQLHVHFTLLHKYRSSQFLSNQNVVLFLSNKQILNIVTFNKNNLKLLHYLIYFLLSFVLFQETKHPLSFGFDFELMYNVSKQVICLIIKKIYCIETTN